VAARIHEQYELGLQEMAAGQYFRARQRFEYVIEQDPNFPGVTDNLATVLLQLNTTATPTVQPTPTLTPTPDLRGVEELYSQSQQSLTNSDWTTAIDTLLNLRKADPNFHTVEVDGMLYLALRNRGIDKIGKQADLEGGLYDLALAAQFGPLDSEAQGYKSWASLYLTGASFWDLNWEEAVRYFEQVAPALPGLRDGSGMTASERYRQALIGYGHQLARQAEDDPSLWCSAVEKYEMALSFGPDAEAETALDDAAQNCAGISDEQDIDEGDNDESSEEPPPAEEPTPDPGYPPPAEPPPAEPPTAEPPPAEQPTPEPPPADPAATPPA
jgi:tetratricopeptide (TPR) repeat protein